MVFSFELNLLTSLGILQHGAPSRLFFMDRMAQKIKMGLQR